MENKIGTGIKYYAGFINKKVNRSKFFKSMGIGILGFAVLNSLPFKLFKTVKQKDAVAIQHKGEKVKIQINNLAIKRNKIGGKNA